MNDIGTGRLFKNQTYHHAALRALNQVVSHGADISEVLQATTKMRAGDEQNWFAEWTALADRNMGRARIAKNPRSRGQALLRAHTYYARARSSTCRRPIPSGPRRTTRAGRSSTRGSIPSVLSTRR